MMNMKKYGSIIMGSAILAFGIFNIHARCDISEGGVLGLSLLLYRWFGISPGLSCLLMDCVAMAAGTMLLRSGFLWDSILSAVVYAVWYALFEQTGPMLPDLTAHPLAAAIAGGLFVGVGTALIVRYGCAAGADDTLALIAHAKAGIPLGAFYILSDVTVLGLSLTYIPLQRIAWSLLTVMVSSGIIGILCREQNRRA